MDEIKYIIVKPNVINNLDFTKKRGKYRIYISDKDSIRYNNNKFFFQPTKGMVKFRGIAPEEIKKYRQYTHTDILKKIRSTWGQWKRNN